MFKFLNRVSAFFARYFFACENIGWIGATKLFSIARLKRSLISVYIKAMGRRFYFRSNADIGVMSHFWIPLYILESQTNRPLRIIDAGANIGDETARFRHFHPSADIVAIKAESSNFDILKMNFEHDKKTILLHAALWSEKTELNLLENNGTNETFKTIAESNEKTIAKIKTVTIDEIMANQHWDEIDILKMDIEGAEKEIFLHHFENWINKVAVIIFETPDCDAPGGTQIIFRAIGNIDFNCYRADERLVLIRKNAPFTLHVSPFLQC